VVRRLLLWCFRNRATGAITIAQTPNLSLSVFLVATAILWLTHPTGALSTMAKVVATGSLIVWALDEVVRGVNPWRRFLGVAVLTYVVSTVRLWAAKPEACWIHLRLPHPTVISEAVPIDLYINPRACRGTEHALTSIQFRF
jgi:hypothetical protein